MLREEVASAEETVVVRDLVVSVVNTVVVREPVVRAEGIVVVREQVVLVAGTVVVKELVASAAGTAVVREHVALAAGDVVLRELSEGVDAVVFEAYKAGYGRKWSSLGLPSLFPLTGDGRRLGESSSVLPPRCSVGTVPTSWRGPCM